MNSPKHSAGMRHRICDLLSEPFGTEVVLASAHDAALTELAELRESVSTIRADRDLAIKRMAELRAELEKARADAARYVWLMDHREYVFRDGNGLWVGSWKRAVGDTRGIIRALIDSEIAAMQKERG
jgi:hypothetical protein